MIHPPKFLNILLLVFLLVVPSVGHTADAEHDHGEAETVWTCSMHPQIQLPEFGQCPICFMDLIEVVKDTSGGKRQSLRQISFDERARKLAQVKVVPVNRGSAGIETRMVGKVDYDETRVGNITAWVAGRIDKLYVDYTGSRVKKGQAMAEIYSPELLTAQAELIQAVGAVQNFKDSGSTILKNTVVRTEKAARDKLRLLGLTSEQVRELIRRGEPLDHTTLFAPMSGIVIKKNVSEGMYVQTGAPIYTIADLDRLWVVLEAYESDLQSISLGQQVSFNIEAFPGRIFQGKVAYVDPVVDNKTRTIRVRLNVINEDGVLKPGMFVRAQARELAPVAGDNLPLLIPVSAPLVTGKRALVYVQLPDQEGVYLGKEVILGPRRGQYYEVESGLVEGELVVSAGNFKIDSAIQLQARPSMMNPFLAKGADTKEALPELFLSKLQGLNKLFVKLSAQLHQGNKAELAPLLDAFQSRLQELADPQLSGEEKLIWQEMVMLLRGDVILLQEASSREERERIYAALAEHFHDVRRQYTLQDGTATGAASEVQVALGLVVNDYFILQKSLAADDLAGARKAAGMVEAALQKVLPLLATPLAAELKKAGEELVAGGDLDAIRTAFYPLSQALSQAVVDVGVEGVGPVFQQFCPMAFGNTGATWLAENEEINNPYFGAMMLRCGEVRKQLHDGE
ncbi:MAG: efflux RND transporter periplasmic adaptor subunit [Proteobacteria bacterium]|nr:efflux RND transporter periplasmic adaptor subunit [Pseudomonadota bacterium]MBU1640478.1 efflux RND transporter periplasmic adaptor subunit [Pseudomonadota bacterium]